MNATLISEALTGAQARAVADAFLRALEHFDKSGDVARLVREQQEAAAMAEEFAVPTRKAA